MSSPVARIPGHALVVRAVEAELDRRSSLWFILGGTALSVFALLVAPFLLGDHYGPWDLVRTSRALLLMTAIAVTPVVLWIYRFLPKVIDGLVDEFRQNEVFAEASPEQMRRLDKLFQRQLTVIRSRACRGLAVLVGVGVGAYGFIVQYEREYVRPLGGVWAGSPLLRLIVALSWLVGSYLVFVSLLRLVVQFVSVNELFRSFPVVVHPLHPDGAGGLGAMGRILWRWLLVAAVLGAVTVGVGLIYRFNVGINSLQQPQILFMGGLYVVLLPLLVVGFLWRPHLAMLEARSRHLAALATEFDRHLTERLMLEPDPGAAARARASLLRQIKGQHDWERNVFPRWPMPVGQLGRALTAAIVPLPAIIVPLVQAVVPLIQHELNRPVP
jgi:hypothetical protein